MTDPKHIEAARKLVREIDRTAPCDDANCTECLVFDREHAVHAFSEALQQAADEARAECKAALREAFYPQRDQKLPGVWLMCRHRDEDGEAMIEDIRIFAREADVKKHIETFSDAVFSGAGEGKSK
jgi:hypothetical protein